MPRFTTLTLFILLLIANLNSFGYSSSNLHCNTSFGFKAKFVGEIVRYSYIKIIIESTGDPKRYRVGQIPFKGSWTAGQVAEHLAKSISGIPGLLVTETKDVERDPFEKCAVINSIFLNFEEKYQAPSFTLPSDTPKQVLHFTNVFTRTSDEINHLMRERDMTKVFTRFPFPQVGELTGWEWICFAASHSIRHTRQLENIFNHVNP